MTNDPATIIALTTIAENNTVQLRSFVKKCDDREAGRKIYRQVNRLLVEMAEKYGVQRKIKEGQK